MRATQPFQLHHSLTVFYSCYCKNHWKSIVKTHFIALEGLTVFMHARGSAKDKWFIQRQAQIRSITLIFIQSRQDFEHGTISSVRQYADRHPSGVVLYLHTKSTGNLTPEGEPWLRYMNRFLLGDIRKNVSRLISSNRDTLGVLYGVDRKQVYPLATPVFVNYFAGNFWLAKCSYLRKLPRYEKYLGQSGDRYAAESYIGIGQPRCITLDSRSVQDIHDDIIPFILAGLKAPTTGTSV